MSDGRSKNAIDAECEDLKETIACVKQVTRDFDAMSARRREQTAEFAKLTQELQRMGGGSRGATRSQSHAGRGDSAFDAALRQIEQSLIRQKARGKELSEAASAFAQALVAWAEDLEKRRQQPVSPPSRHLAEVEATVLGTEENPRPFGPELLLAKLRASYQLNLEHASDSPRAWKDFMANENDTDFRKSYSAEYLKYSDSTLPGFGAQFNNQVFTGDEVNYIGVGIGFAMRGIPVWAADDIAAIRKYIAMLGSADGYQPMTDAEYNWMKFGYDYASQRMGGDRWWK